eukprot:GHVT01037206.1.p1 GENE.GHVT01037206.1~~GHVT01037206.1.p1  ORF type:complete len:127 (+),score=5.21 GHVT01037206.1:375-755(+)
MEWRRETKTLKLWVMLRFRKHGEPENNEPAVIHGAELPEKTDDTSYQQPEMPTIVSSHPETPEEHVRSDSGPQTGNRGRSGENEDNPLWSGILMQTVQEGDEDIRRLRNWVEENRRPMPWIQKVKR